MDKPQIRIKITPSYLWEKGYKYKSVGIQGADQWQGMGYWIHDKTGFTLRGNKGVSSPLRLSGYFN